MNNPCPPDEPPAAEPGERPLTRSDISTTFAKGLSVLKAFESVEARLTLADIARAADLDRATTRRLVLTLVHLGYVRRAGRGFTLTPKILLLTGGFLQSRQFVKRVVPILGAHSRAIDAPIYLAVRDGHDAVYIAHASLDDTDISLGFGIGSRLPLLQSAIGRALVVGEPEAVAVLVNEAPLRAYTPASVMDRTAIAEAITEAATQGYVYADGEFEAGVAALALPMPSAEGTVTAVGISAARERFDAPYKEAVLTALRACRQDLSRVEGII